MDGTSPFFNEKCGKTFHSTFARLLYIGKRARPDIQLPVGFLGTRVVCPTEEDWKRLQCALECLNSTINIPLKLGMSDISIVSWWVDIFYGVHVGVKSHTSGVVYMGKGCVYSTSRKQKLNTICSTESKLVGISDILHAITWDKMYV